MKKLICIFFTLLFLFISGSIEAKTKRSHKARADFQKTHPCPSTGKTYGKCSGFVVDHIIPLCAGGSDNPQNMQWQLIEESKIKDIEERKQCKGMKKKT